ncbi:MAG TPA: DNA-directed RNA polymerase subunit alpha [Thermomicrobiaceae bacterium]|nr:DNA-directed RNA polymerase subunit alpha [Thermomicrobiaceae bacterium]
MLEIAQPRVQQTHTGENYGRFEIEPLEPGYGITLGNALRRILLRSLTGAAIVRVRITDVWHEFSTIEGVREDVTEIVLNLKQIRLQTQLDSFREARASLYARGEGPVRAGDIDWPAEVEVVNPDQIVATLDNERARLEMDLVVMRGRGYQPAEAQEIFSIGEIPVDAIFTPIEKVNYVVEHTRVGQMTDFDRLILEIVTDGTVDPGEALSTAAQILVDHGRLIADFNRQPAEATEEAARPMTEADNKPLSELGLSPRVLNALRSRHIERVGQVLDMDPDQLLSIRNFGPRSLQELKDKLAEHGYTLEVPTGLGVEGLEDNDALEDGMAEGADDEEEQEE